MVSPAPQYPLKLILNTHNFDGVDKCQHEHGEIQRLAGLKTGSDAVPFNMDSFEIMSAIFGQVLARDANGTSTAGTRPDYW